MGTKDHNKLSTLVKAAEQYAYNYKDDDRQDIVTDVLNAYYAGSTFSRQQVDHLEEMVKKFNQQIEDQTTLITIQESRYKRLEKFHNDLEQLVQQRDEQIKELLELVSRMKEDVDRYNWLKDQHARGCHIFTYGFTDNLDKRVDHHRKEG